MIRTFHTFNSRFGVEWTIKKFKYLPRIALKPDGIVYSVILSKITYGSFNIISPQKSHSVRLQRSDDASSYLAEFNHNRKL